MGAKAKPAAATKIGDDDGEDLSTEKFMKLYKANCKQLGIDSNKQVTKKYQEEYLDAGTHLRKFHIWDTLGWQGTRALMDALRVVKYTHCFSIRFWKTHCEDEGLRCIVQFISEGTSPVQILELLNCGLTKLSCSFIGKMMLNTNKSIRHLKLDHNDIGSAGVKELAQGLRSNKNLESLSMQYCNIDKEGSRSLFEVVIFQQSVMTELNLQGNCLRDDGTISLLRGLSAAKTLTRIILADNQFIESDDVLQAIRGCFIRNKTLVSYDFRFNFIENDGVEQIGEFLVEAPHVTHVDVPERLSKEVIEAF